jgi:signal peptidase I
MFRKPTIASSATVSLAKTQPVDECKTALAVQTLRAGSSIRLQVLGSSMLPSIWPGDVVSIDKVSVDEIVPGDIVVCERDDRVFVHRFLGKSESNNGICWRTRGDSLPQNDPPFSESHLLGRVSRILRGDRAIIPKPTRSSLARFLSWMICYLDSARNLALRLHALRTRSDSPHVRSRSMATRLLRNSREGRLAPR